MNSINREIQDLINEQFTASDIDFSDDSINYDINVYNKTIIIPEEVFNKILNNDDVSEKEIQYLNDLYDQVKPSNRFTLKKIIRFYSEHYPKYSLNWLDVSNITDMQEMFYNTAYDGDISKWNVSRVQNMHSMFYCSSFTGDISQWDVSHVVNMSWLFTESKFNGDISQWDVSNVEDMFFMFKDSCFDSDISKWDISKVKNTSFMFANTPFNHDISKWNITKVRRMDYMFYNTPFNQDISEWDVSNVRTYYHIFENCRIIDSYKPKFKEKMLVEQFSASDLFDIDDTDDYHTNIFNKDLINPQKVYYDILDNQPVADEKIKQLNNFNAIYKVTDKNDLRAIINYYSKYHKNDSLNWLDVSEITNMQNLFKGTDETYCKYNGDISKWNVSNVRNMSGMFMYSYFDNDISQWDVSHVTDMSYMFCRSKFKQDISQWDVSRVINMDEMFFKSLYFNGNISNWNVSSVITMEGMFANSIFNQDISGWDVSNVKNMSYMFYESKFNRDISIWKVNSLEKCDRIFTSCDILKNKKYLPKRKK